MKKVILALAIVSVSFAACNNADKKEETPAVDTTAAPAPAPAVDTTKAPVVDTTKAPVADTTKK
jgi:PBP1b-binding outer membrane lipoprotein LpoB